VGELERNAPGDLGYGFLVGSAFVLTALPAFLLWPMTARNGRFSGWRAAGFGALVVLVSSFLWSLASNLAWPIGPRTEVLAPVFPNLMALDEAFGKALLFTILGSIMFGWLTFPVGIGIAWAVAAWANARLDGNGAAGAGPDLRN
jgi:hypothetical protein